jgi:transcriptional regulator with XRE-family HTH domain
MDRSTGSPNGKVTDHLPLSVMLFHNAMERNLTMGGFARELGLSPLSLRQFVEGNTQRPRGKTIETIAGALDISVDDARRRLNLPPEEGPPFSDWLQRQMKGRFSRARLTKETKISDGALRNYLAGQTLPDSDQARRLADALGQPTLDVARLIIAHQTAQAGGMTVKPGAGPDDEGAAEEGAATAPLAAVESAPTAEIAASAPAGRDEEHILHLWRQLHPQARRATLIYIAGLLAEG